MPKGIVRKIFITTTSVLMTFFVFQLIFQNTYLDILYKNSKINNLRKNLSAFVDEVQSSQQSNWYLTYLSDNYSRQNDAPILIINENYEILNTDFFNEFNLLTVDLGKGKEIHILVDYLKNNSNISLKDLTYNERILIQGVQIGNSSYVEPLIINLNHVAYSNKKSFLKWRKDREHSDLIKEYNGYIEQIKIITRDYTEFNYASHVLYNEILDVLCSKQDIETYVIDVNKKIIEEKRGNDFYVILSEKATINEKEVYFLTLQKIENISFIFSALNPYYILMYIICIIILLIISFFYTQWITNPLIYLNNTAKKIADLDFSAKAVIDSKDELSQLADSLNLVSENLEKTINDLKLSNKQLANEAANRTQSEKRIRYLLTSLSHEFKTPLGIISGFVDMLRDGIYEKEPEYYFNVISEEIEKLTHMISETIELSKLETSYYSLNQSDFNIKKCLEKVLSIFEAKISKKELFISINTQDYYVTADKLKIEQVLINIISNAVKYTERGKKISICLEEYNDEEIIVYVQNEGKITDDEIDKIWNRYYRIEKRHKKNSKGTGLGLEIVKNILELHDATYGVESSNDKVKFYFTLKKYTY